MTGERVRYRISPGPAWTSGSSTTRKCATIDRDVTGIQDVAATLLMPVPNHGFGGRQMTSPLKGQQGGG